MPQIEITRREFLSLSGLVAAGVALDACSPLPTPAPAPHVEMQQPEPPLFTGELKAQYDEDARALVLKDSTGKTIINGPKIEELIPAGPNILPRNALRFRGGSAQDIASKNRYPWLYYETKNPVAQTPEDLHTKETIMILNRDKKVSTFSFEAGDQKELPHNTWGLDRVIAIHDQLLVQFWYYADDPETDNDVSFLIDPKTGTKKEVPVQGEAIGVVGSTIIFDANPYKSRQFRDIVTYDIQSGASEKIASNVQTAGVSDQGIVAVLDADNKILTKNLLDPSSEWQVISAVAPIFDRSYSERIAFTPDGTKLLTGEYLKESYGAFLYLVDMRDKSTHTIALGSSPGVSFSFENKLDKWKYGPITSNDQITITNVGLIGGKYRPIATEIVYLSPDKDTGLYYREMLVGVLSWDLAEERTATLTQADGTMLSLRYREPSEEEDKMKIRETIQKLIDDSSKGILTIVVVQPSDHEITDGLDTYTSTVKIVAFAELTPDITMGNYGDYRMFRGKSVVSFFGDKIESLTVAR